jgi:hypothetical protein
MAETFRLFLDTTVVTAGILKVLRAHLIEPLSEIRQAIESRQPILQESPHHNDYEEFLVGTIELLEALDAEGIGYHLEIDGELAPSRQVLRNLLESRQDGLVQIKRMDDLKSGEPCIETLEWLKGKYPSGPFYDTLKQIVEGDGYHCDEETVAWARRELDAAKPDRQPEGRRS